MLPIHKVLGLMEGGQTHTQITVTQCIHLKMDICALYVYAYTHTYILY